MKQLLLVVTMLIAAPSAYGQNFGSAFGLVFGEVYDDYSFSDYGRDEPESEENHMYAYCSPGSSFEDGFCIDVPAPFPHPYLGSYHLSLDDHNRLFMLEARPTVGKKGTIEECMEQMNDMADQLSRSLRVAIKYEKGENSLGWDIDGWRGSKGRPGTSGVGGMTIVNMWCQLELDDGWTFWPEVIIRVCSAIHPDSDKSHC